ADDQDELRLQAPRRDEPLHEAREANETNDHHIEGAAAVEARNEGRAAMRTAPIKIERRIDKEAAYEREHAHEERQRQSVPHGKAVSRRLIPQNRACRGLQNRTDRLARKNPDE